MRHICPTLKKLLYICIVKTRGQGVMKIKK